MTGNIKIGTALVGGYLLGRTKKAKMAIGFGMFLAGRKLPLDPAQLGKLVAGSPVLDGLNDRVRKELVEATKNAAAGALTKRATGLADALHDRTRALDTPLRGTSSADEQHDADDRESDGDGRESDGDDRADGDDRERDGDGREAGSDAEAAPRRKAEAAAESSPAKTASGAARRTASGGGAKARAGSTPCKAKEGTRSAPPARKTAGTAKKATSSAASRTRGGGHHG